MGSWTDNKQEDWKWFYVPQENRLYERYIEGWKAYSMEGGRIQRLYKRFLYAGSQNHHPPHMLRATVFTISPGRIVLSSYGLDTPPAPAPALISSLADTIAALPTGSNWAVCRFDATDNGQRVTQAIRNGTAIAVSDGSSFKDSFGTSALILEASDSTDNIVAVNVVPSNPDSQSSYRSKLAGIFGQVTLVNALCKTHGITQGAIECGCDSLGALQKVFILDTEIKTAGSNFDLLSATRVAIRDSPVTWTFRHVKGHQDDNIETNLD
jgi:hypothetical protein